MGKTHWITIAIVVFLLYLAWKKWG